MSPREFNRREAVPASNKRKLGTIKADGWLAEFTVVGTLRNHEDLLMNYFKVGKLYNIGIVEGLNLRINLCMRKAYGYRNFDLLQGSLYHHLKTCQTPNLPTNFADEPV